MATSLMELFLQTQLFDWIFFVVVFFPSLAAVSGAQILCSALVFPVSFYTFINFNTVIPFNLNMLHYSVVLISVIW